jgi:hypothetical protein
MPVPLCGNLHLTPKVKVFFLLQLCALAHIQPVVLSALMRLWGLGEARYDHTSSTHQNTSD